MAVDKSIEGETVRPAGGEVDHIEVLVVFGGLSDPAQQNLLAVCLL